MSKERYCRVCRTPSLLRLVELDRKERRALGGADPLDLPITRQHPQRSSETEMNSQELSGNEIVGVLGKPLSFSVDASSFEASGSC